MSQLAPCPACARHVRVSESECPFCSTPLELSATPGPSMPSPRLSRAALLAFGAALAAGVSVVSCGGDGDGGSGGAGGQSTGGASSGGGSSGSDGSAGSGGSAGQNTGGMAGNIAPPYGIPPDF